MITMLSYGVTAMRTAIVITLALAASLTAKAASIPNAPLSVQVSAPPMVMIVAGRDHRLFYEAYNDASDLDGDGTIDYRFKPSITYLGLFDPNLCYRYNRGKARFEPQARASGPARTCRGLWSGNWLNYVTTARIDALRVVLYGGFREVDTANETVLRRAYIPQDAHSWAKEYESPARDGYDIRQYTPLPLPSRYRRHFFGNLTRVAGVDCRNLANCSDHRPPILAVVKNSYKRVWEWASKERPVLDGSHGGELTDYIVRVQVCTRDFHDGCKRYPNGNYKPIGLLHEFSENNAMLFGLLTGSYDKNQNGGRLRKVVSSFSTEYDPHTGIFKRSLSAAPIYWTLNFLRIRDFNNRVWRNGNYYRGGWILNRSARPGEFPDWSNPVGEMLYEAMRYFAGRRSPTGAYMGSERIDHEVGLTSAGWDDPYSRNSRAQAPRCARPNILAVSDVNVSYDSDDLPGAYFRSRFSGDLPGLNVKTLADEITRNERLPATTFIGQSGSYYDTAPTPKQLDSLGTIRGLWEEPTHQGSYYSAAVAYYGKKTDIRPDLPGTQSVNTFVVALSSPLPRIEVPARGGRRITLVPFAKSVSVGRGGGISPAKGAFQPTNQIVDFYVDTIVNSGPHDRRPGINGGRYYARFVINFEDVEQGADHDMDAVVRYEVWTRHDGSVGVKLTPTYEAGGIRHRMGYVISGTTADGTYLEVQDESDTTAYFLNTPPGKRPGHCDPPTGKPECNRLPYLRGNPGSATRVFWPGSSSASFLENPLWYAAKWGSFKDLNGNNKPDLTEEWDENGDGQPDGYFLVRNPTMLREKLRATLESIAARSGSHSRMSVSSSTITSDTAVYSARFNTADWSGDVIAQRITATGVSPNPLWRASDRMPAPTNRKIWVRRNDGRVVPFEWNQLTRYEHSLLSNTDVEYLRGDRSNERQNGGTLRNRPLGNVIGDIIHSNVFYAKNTRTVFVGANDGMLHAFDAQTGDELFAYIPRAVLPRLKNLTKPNYTHEYFVDGESAWIGREHVGKDILVTTLGRGGRALFALDVSDPAHFLDRHALWETGFDPDLGYVLSRPIIAKLNNGRWGVIVGNGYNAPNAKAVLLIYDLYTGVLIRKIDTRVGGDNGLAGPEGWDDDMDGDVDYVYAGDLKGNVWKFDLRASDPAQWKIAYGTPNSPQPLFVARDHTGQRQPITAPMTVVLNNVYGSPTYGKRYVIFGTGSYFRDGDPNSTQRQSWYGLIDNDDPTPIAGRNELASSGIAREGTLNGQAVRTFALPPDLTGKKGWYLDFSTHEGERVVSKSKILPLLRPTLAVSSIIPDRDPCSPGGSGFINVIDPFTGGRIDLGVIDVNNNNDFNDDKLEDVYVGGFAPNVGMPSEPAFAGNQLVFGSSAGTVKSVRAALGRRLLGRTSWREIVRD